MTKVVPLIHQLILERSEESFDGVRSDSCTNSAKSNATIWPSSLVSSLNS